MNLVKKITTIINNTSTICNLLLRIHNNKSSNPNKIIAEIIGINKLNNSQKKEKQEY